MPVDCPCWVVYPVKISAKNIEISRHGDENTVKVEVGQCISKVRPTHSCHHFSAKKKNLLCFWSFLVALTMGYKIIYFPNSENIGHLRNTQAHYSCVIIFLLFWLVFRRFRSEDYDLSQNQYHIWNQHQKLSRLMYVSNVFVNCFSPKNSPLRTALVGHAMTHVQYFEYKWPRIVQKGYILLPKDSP